jgi:hypothetical protein
VQTKRLWSEAFGTMLRLRVTTHALRCIDKEVAPLRSPPPVCPPLLPRRVRTHGADHQVGRQGGLDNYLVNTKPDKLDSELGLWLKELVSLSLALARCCSISGFSCALSSPVCQPSQRCCFVRSL